MAHVKIHTLLNNINSLEDVIHHKCVYHDTTASGSSRRQCRNVCDCDRKVVMYKSGVAHKTVDVELQKSTQRLCEGLAKKAMSREETGAELRKLACRMLCERHSHRTRDVAAEWMDQIHSIFGAPEPVQRTSRGRPGRGSTPPPMPSFRSHHIPASAQKPAPDAHRQPVNIHADCRDQIDRLKAEVFRLKAQLKEERKTSQWWEAESKRKDRLLAILKRFETYVEDLRSSCGALLKMTDAEFSKVKKAY